MAAIVPVIVGQRFGRWFSAFASTIAGGTVDLGPSTNRFTAPVCPEPRAEGGPTEHGLRLHVALKRQNGNRTRVRREATMKRSTVLLAISAAVFTLGSVSASAGPCAQQITTLSKQMAASDAGSGPTKGSP